MRFAGALPSQAKLRILSTLSRLVDDQAPPGIRILMCSDLLQALIQFPPVKVAGSRGWNLSYGSLTTCGTETTQANKIYLYVLFVLRIYRSFGDCLRSQCVCAGDLEA